VATFPLIGGGHIVSQYPYTTAPAFLHTKVDMPCGVRWSYSWRTNPLRTFVVSYRSIPTADVKTLEEFFNSMSGRYGTFSFMDLEAGNVHPNCRFDQDNFQVTYNGVNNCSVTLRIAEFAG